MILGVGIDVVGVDRFAAELERAPQLAERLFTPAELEYVGWPLDDDASEAVSRVVIRSMAVRFAAKEALSKALNAPGNLAWHDAEVVTQASGRPHWAVRGSVTERCEQLGVHRLQVSLSHDAGLATAIVLAED